MRNATVTRKTRPSARFAIDPYRIDEMTWTRTELLKARGQLATTAPRPVRSHRRRQSR